MEILIFYGGGAIVLILAGIIFYLFARASRKTYRCPQCGERMTTEYLDAKRCGMCGAPFKREY